MGPSTLAGRVFESGAGLALRGGVLLVEQVLAQPFALLGAQRAGLTWGQQRERRVRAVVDGGLLDCEHRGDLGVALALAQQQREHGA